MKFYIDKTEILNIDLTQQKLLENDLADVPSWIAGDVGGKINACHDRFKSEWIPRLMNDASVDSIPANINDFVAMVVARADYKNKAQCEAESTAIQCVNTAEENAQSMQKLLNLLPQADAAKKADIIAEISNIKLGTENLVNQARENISKAIQAAAIPKSTDAEKTAAQEAASAFLAETSTKAEAALTLANSIADQAQKPDVK